MFKPSLTIHKDPKGVVNVLVCSEDAGKCIDAYKGCKEPGQIQLIVRGNFQKQKKVLADPNQSSPKPAAKPAKAQK